MSIFRQHLHVYVRIFTSDLVTRRNTALHWHYSKMSNERDFSGQKDLSTAAAIDEYGYESVLKAEYMKTESMRNYTPGYRSSLGRRHLRISCIHCL